MTPRFIDNENSTFALWALQICVALSPEVILAISALRRAGQNATQWPPSSLQHDGMSDSRKGKAATNAERAARVNP